MQKFPAVILLVLTILLLLAFGGCGKGGPANSETPAGAESTNAPAEGPTAAPETTAASGEDTTAAPEDTAASGEGTTAAPETTAASGEGTTAAPETTKAPTEGTTASGTETTAKAAEYTTAPGAETTAAPLDPNRDWEPVETLFGRLCYPDDLFEFLQTSQTRTADAVKVLFVAAFNGKQIDLFEISIGSGTGAPVGKLTGPDGVQRNVFLTLFKTEDQTGFSAQEMDRVFAMQEAVNFVLDHLK